MRGWGRLGAALAFAVTVTAGPAKADGQLVVVEFFTSQGCSACPPADEVMAELADWPHVLPLGLHVDYWDYIGWADTFADPAFTERQKGYARAAGSRVVYTPQIIVGGTEMMKGLDPMALAKTVHRHAAEPSRINHRVEGRSVHLQRTPPFSPLVLHRVDYHPGQTVSITAGENAGAEVFYTNIVRHWEKVATWIDGQITVDLPPRDGLVTVLLAQDPGPGAVRKAIRLYDPSMAAGLKDGSKDPH